VALDKLGTGYSISLPLIGMNRFNKLQGSDLASRFSLSQEDIIEILVTAACRSMKDHIACRKMSWYGLTETEALILENKLVALQCPPPTPIADGNGEAEIVSPATDTTAAGGSSESSPTVSPVPMVSPMQNHTDCGVATVAKTTMNSNEAQCKTNSEPDTTLNSASKTDIILGMRGVTTTGTAFYKNEVRVIFERRKPQSVDLVHDLLQLVRKVKYHESMAFTFWVSEEKASKCRERRNGQCGASPPAKLYVDHKKGIEIKFVRACDECIRDDIDNNQVRGKRKASAATLEQEDPEDEKAKSKAQKKLTVQKEILEGHIKFFHPFASESEKNRQRLDTAMDKLEKVNEDLLKLAS